MPDFALDANVRALAAAFGRDMGGVKVDLGVAVGRSDEALAASQIPLSPPYTPFASEAQVASVPVPASLGLITIGQTVYARSSEGSVQSADGAHWAPVSGPIDIDFTVRVPSQHPTVQAALDAIHGVSVAPNKAARILIESGHQLTHGFVVKGGARSSIVLAAEDPVVRTVETGFVPANVPGHPEGPRAVAYFDDCVAPRWSFLLRGWGDPNYNGIQTFRGAIVHVDPGCGVQNMRRNLAMRQGGIISANDTLFDEARLNCVILTNGITGSISGISVNDGWTQWAIEGASFADASLHISRASCIQAQGMKATRCGAAAVTVRRSFASVLSAEFGTVGLVSGNATVPLRYQDGSHVNARFATFNGAELTESNISGQTFNSPTVEGTCYYTTGAAPGYNATGGALEYIPSDGAVTRAGFYRWRSGDGWGPEPGSSSGGATRLDGGTDRGVWIATAAAGSSKEPKVYAKSTGGEAGVYGPWRQLFHQGNFLGTVASDAGGIPTGAALESSGSFSGGYYMRFLDGTQVCYRAFNTPATATFDQTVAFAAPFLAGETIYGGHIGGNTILSGGGFPDRERRYHCITVTASTAGWRVYLGADVPGMHNNYPTSTEALPIRLFAVGRWR